MSNRGFYGWRKQSSARKNARVVRAFEEDLRDNVRRSMTSSLIYVAPKMLQSVVNQAGFSDYTGVLINSYMAGMFVNGKYAPDIKGLALPGSWVGSPRALWSSSEPGIKTVRIRKGRPYIYSTREFVKKNGKNTKLWLRKHTRERSSNVHWLINKRTYRNPASTEFMKFNKEEFSPTGYGRNLSVLKSSTPSLRRGTEIIISNGAPYAKRVQESHAGSNVMPQGVAEAYVSIVRKELERNLRLIYGKNLRR